MLNNEAVQEIEVTVAEAEAQVTLYEALKRLEANPDFQLVIQENFLKIEPHRLTILKAADATVQNPGVYRNVCAALDGVGQFGQFLNRVHVFGRLAQQTLEDAREELDAMAEEQS